jgi:hypothetical protein
LMHVHYAKLRISAGNSWRPLIRAVIIETASFSAFLHLSHISEENKKVRGA